MRRSAVYFFGLVCVAVLIFFEGTAGAQALQWNIETVDSAAGAGRYSAIALYNDTPAIAYAVGSSQLKYAYRDASTSTWNQVTFPTTFTRLEDVSLGTNSPDLLHLVYYNGTSPGDARLSYSSGALGDPWQSTTIDGTGDEDAGQYVSLSVNQASGKAHVIYKNSTSGAMLHGRMVGSSSLINETITTGSFGPYTSIVVDNSGIPHLLFTTSESGTTRLRYWRGTGSETTGYTWASSGGASVYSNLGSVPLSDPHYKDIALDPNGSLLHIAFYKPGDGDLYYVNRGAGSTLSSFSPAPTAIDTAGDVGRYVSIASCPNGSIHIAYEDVTNVALKYARKNPGETSWSFSPVTGSDGSVEDGQFISLACDSDSLLQMSFYDPSGTGSLKYASRPAGICGNGTIEAGETCDDSNTVSGDGCSSSCQSEPVCGNGTCESGETCLSCAVDCGICAPSGFSPPITFPLPTLPTVPSPTPTAPATTDVGTTTVTTPEGVTTTGGMTTPEGGGVTTAETSATGEIPETTEEMPQGAGAGAEEKTGPFGAAGGGCSCQLCYPPFP